MTTGLITGDQFLGQKFRVNMKCENRFVFPHLSLSQVDPLTFNQKRWSSLYRQIHLPAEMCTFQDICLSVCLSVSLSHTFHLLVMGKTYKLQI